MHNGHWHLNDHALSQEEFIIEYYVLEDIACART